MMTSKADMAAYIRNWVARTSDPTAKLPSLMKMNSKDISVLLLAIQKAEKQAAPHKAFR